MTPSNSTQLKPITLITGGSQGIGKALAFEFAANGYDVLLVARNQSQLDRTAEQLREKFDVTILTLASDLIDVESTDQIEALLAQENFYCQHLVNNAGFGLAGDFVSHNEQAISDMIELNVRALTDLSRRFLPDMLERQKGGILNISSMGGLIPGPYQAAYYASKAYVISLSQALSWECWGTGVRISTLAPGPVRTRFHRVMGARSELYMKSGAGNQRQKGGPYGV